MTPPPDTCPDGQTGTPPSCVTPPDTCDEGQTGTPPNCVTPLPGIKKPTNTTATFDGKRLGIRLKCGKQFKPKCLNMKAFAVTGKSKKAKKMSSVVNTKIKAGKWKLITLTVKSKYRDEVQALTAIDKKTLTVRIDIKYRKKNGKKGKKRAFHTYKVREKG